MSTRLGAAISGVGVLVAAFATVTVPSANADIVAPSGEIAPQSGSIWGGTIVRISGENLEGFQGQAFFGDEPALLALPVGPSEFLVVSPEHEEGTVDVTILLNAETDSLPVSTSTVTTTVPTETVTQTVFETVTGSPTPTTFLTTSDVTVTTDVSTTYETEVANSYDPELAEDGLIPFVVGQFTYLDTLTVTPDSGPTAGNTPVEIESPYLGDLVVQCVISAFSGGPGDGTTTITADRLSAASIELEGLLDLDVFFDGEAGTDSRLVIPNVDLLLDLLLSAMNGGGTGDATIDDILAILQGITVKTTTPAHAKGAVDVDVVVYDSCGLGDLLGGPSTELRLAGAALPPDPEGDDIVFGRADAYTYIAPAPTTDDTVTETVTAPVTETEVVTVVPTTTDPVTSSTGSTTSTSTSSSTAAVIPTSAAVTSTAPILSATGVSSATMPMALTALGLLIAGGLIMMLSRRNRIREH